MLIFVGGPLHYSDSPSPLKLGLGVWDWGLGLVNKVMKTSLKKVKTMFIV